MKRKLLYACTALSLILTACGQSDTSRSAMTGNIAMKEASPADSYSNSGSYEMDEAVEAGAYADEAYVADVDMEEATRESNPIDVDENKANETTTAKLDREKIVYNGRLSIETLDYNKSKTSIKKLVNENDGIIQSENEYYNDSNWYYNTSDSVRTLNLTVRVPSAKFNRIMDGADGMGRVTEKNMDASNVTREYYDVQARLNSKKAELSRFEALLDRAEKINDILEIEEHITDVQYEIDSAKSQLENLNLDVAYSTVTISLTEVIEFTSDDGKSTSKLQDTLLGAWHFFESFLWGLFRFVLYVGPCAAVIGIILYFLRKLYKKFHKDKPKKERRPLFRRRKQPTTPVEPASAPQSTEPTADTTDASSQNK